MLPNARVAQFHHRARGEIVPHRVICIVAQRTAGSCKLRRSKHRGACGPSWELSLRRVLNLAPSEVNSGEFADFWRLRTEVRREIKAVLDAKGASRSHGFHEVFAYTKPSWRMEQGCSVR